VPWTTAGFHDSNGKEVLADILVSGRFTDIRGTKYMGHLITMKTVRVARQCDFV
jgi:hypothetical protein